MKTIKIKTPAKINLVLEILGRRADGFHEIRSIMQTVSLFDYLNITVEEGSEKITLSGNSSHIPYDENNIVFKAVKLFLEKTGIKNQSIEVYIEKNIPVAAGLAGGSSDAAGTLRGLNDLYGKPLSWEELHSLAAKLGSDVNFCLEGGTCLTTSRGEILEPMPTPELKIILLKPKNLFISAKEAYQRYDRLEEKPKPGNAEFYNDLEKAIIPAYPEIENMKNLLFELGCKNALMSGSGPTVFGIYENDVDISKLSKEYEVFKVHSIKSDNCGVSA
ncbi:MAG: 4-(cytidine 5'-diphospho)-2-C-methyl-D-erythritol kinase [Candidatus Melainabacteria bacterium GWF2_37_15]|nr:MAG: 4-(cytidine 5'-diphospho)-2-C-methyl-D-erythritol kinase [Candidatus Melainabacteria bacterium GWF2_37_15]